MFLLGFLAPLIFVPFPYIGIFFLFKHLYIITGINFSGNCQGPKLLQQFVIIVGIEKVLFQDLTNKSDEAFDAE